MSETSFHFKQFTIHQEKCAMKVGTDAVLLGSYVNSSNANHILDIGTGTGVIALMLAQKSNATVDAIDVDANAFNQSKENFLISPWVGRLKSIHQSFQEFSETHPANYDLIVTNPPYFHHASKPQIESRIHARHGELLTFDELLNGVKKLLLPSGRFYVILPCKEGMEFLDIAQRKGLFCHKIVRIKTKAERNEKRLIMEFDFKFGILTEEEIIIQDEEGNFTDEYVELTSEYYLQLRPVPAPFPQN